MQVYIFYTDKLDNIEMENVVFVGQLVTFETHRSY